MTRVEGVESKEGVERSRRVPPSILSILSILSVLNLACSTPGVPPPTPGVDVTAYEAHLRIDPSTLRVYGRTRIDVRHPADLGVLDLGLDWAMAVRRVTVNGERVEPVTSGDRVRIPLAGGDSSLVELTYGGTVADGIYQTEHEGARVLYAEGWPARTAGWLPAVHAPSDPARLDLHLSVPDGFGVVASGVLARPSRVERGRDGAWRSYHFTLDGDAPVYTFAFAVADSFAVVTDSTAAGLPIRHHLLAADAAEADRLARTPAVLDTLAALLGPYPYAAYSTVQVPMEYAGMENAATPFLRADMYTAADRALVEEVNVHEAVHQWFGNDVVPSDWRDLWLAEGFATYLTTVVYERLDGEDAARRHRVRMAVLPAPFARRAVVPERYDEPEDMLSATVYQKGGAVLHLLRLTLGDAAFFDALRRLRDSYADRPLSTPALQTFLEETTGEDLNALFAYWVYGTTIPPLRTEWDAQTRRLSWTVEGDDATLAGVPYELLVRQGGRDVYVKATDGAVVLPGAARPEVHPVGILLDVR